MTLPDSPSDLTTSRDALINALRSAYKDRLGVPAALEPVVREHGRTLRLGGIAIEKAVMEVKATVRTEMRGDEDIFLGKVVGWAIAGYFAGTTPTGTGRPG